MCVRITTHAHVLFSSNTNPSKLSLVWSAENIQKVLFSELYSCHACTLLLGAGEIAGLLLSSSCHQKAVCVMLW